MMQSDNVLLVSIDSLRTDHISSMGYHRETTPFFDELVAKGTFFEQAFATAGFTLGSVTSFLSSTYPLEHGGYGPLSPDRPSLPEMYRQSGRRTVGIHENGWLTHEYNFDRGFDEYIDLYHSSAPVDRIRRIISDTLPHSSLTFRALKRIDQHFEDFLSSFESSEDSDNGLSRPVDSDSKVAEQAQEAINRDDMSFVWAHFMGPHTPYQPPGEYHGRFADKRVSPAEMESLRTARLQHPEKLSNEEVQTLIDLYDEEIRRLDDNLRTLFNSVDFDTTTVAIIADHGELFGEYGGKFTHGPEMYERMLHVPMLFLGSDVPARRIKTEVSLIDLAPTLLATSDGKDAVPADFRGQPLLDDPSPEPVYACSMHHGTQVTDLDPEYRRLRIREYPWKLVRTGTGTEATDIWYDLREGDHIPSTEDGPAHLYSQMTEFEQLLGADSDYVSDSPSAEMTDRLKNLGYLQ